VVVPLCTPRAVRIARASRRYLYARGKELEPSASRDTTHNDPPGWLDHGHTDAEQKVVRSRVAAGIAWRVLSNSLQGSRRSLLQKRRAWSSYWPGDLRLLETGFPGAWGWQRAGFTRGDLETVVLTTEAPIS
jgi:hypothetical protein